MNTSIDPNIVIICVTALLIAAGTVGSFCTTILAGIWLYQVTVKHKTLENNTNNKKSTISTIPEFEAPENVKMPKNVDYEDLSSLSTDELIKEFNKVEKGDRPRPLGIVERKQKLSLELHRRNQAEQKRQPTEETET